MRTQSPVELQEGWGELAPGFDSDRTGEWGGSLLTRYQRPATTLYDRSDGRFLPVYQTEFDLAVIRAMGRTLSVMAPPLVGGMRNLCNYTIGEGFTFSATRELTSNVSEETARPVVNAIQREIDRLLADNDFTSNFDREIHDCSVIDGESLLHIRPGAGGKVRIFRREPDELRMPAVTRDLEEWLEYRHGICCEDFVPSWSFGVLTRKDDPSEPLAYHFVGDESGVDWDCVPANRVVHIKRNVPRNAKRGFSDFYPIEADTGRGEKLRRNMAEGAAIQASIAYVKQYVAGTSKAGVESLVAGATTSTVTQSTQSGSRSIPAQRHYPGQAVHASGWQFVNGPMGAERAGDFLLVAAYVQRMQAVRWSMPEYMFSGDASNANYSSTMESTSPFVKSCEAEQRFYAAYFVQVLWKALRILWEIGTFQAFGLSWEDLESLIKISAKCPEVATKDELANVQRQSILVDKGVMSLRTMASQNGLDYDAEVADGACPVSGIAPAVDSAVGQNGQPIPQAGGELRGMKLRDVTNIDKLRQRYIDAFRDGAADENTTRLALDGLGYSKAKIDLYLDANPANDPVDKSANDHVESAESIDTPTAAEMILEWKDYP